MFKLCKDTFRRLPRSLRVRIQIFLCRHPISVRASAPATSSNSLTWTSRSSNCRKRKVASTWWCLTRNRWCSDSRPSTKVYPWSIPSSKGSSKERRKSATASLRPEPTSCRIQFIECRRVTHLSKLSVYRRSRSPRFRRSKASLNTSRTKTWS